MRRRDKMKGKDKVAILVIAVLIVPVLIASQVGVSGGVVSADRGRADKINIEILLDLSGSMKEGDRLETAKAGINSYLDTIAGNENINIAFRVFSTCDLDHNQLIADFAPATGEQIALLKEEVNTLTAEGDTGIGYALNLAAQDFEGLKGSNEIILITDGENKCGPDPCEVVATILEERKIRIDVVTIELDPKIEEKLSCIYELTGGAMVSLGQVENLGTALRDITEKVEKEDQAGGAGLPSWLLYVIIVLVVAIVAIVVILLKRKGKGEK